MRRNPLRHKAFSRITEVWTNRGQNEDKVRTQTKPSRRTPAPPLAHDSAPSLERKGRKIRAAGIAPPPSALRAARGEMPAHERAVIDAALAILRARLRTTGDDRVGSPQEARELALLKLAERDAECFAVMFLDSQNKLIAFEELFRGTLTQTSVYPREVVRAALGHNAAALILTHNHPSGCPDPSQADKSLTSALRAALSTVDIRVLDHLIVAGDRVTSMAEVGLM